MLGENVDIAAERVLLAAERLEVVLRTEQTVPEHLLKHYAKRIWELRAAIGAADYMVEKLQQCIDVVQNNMEVLAHYRSGGFRFENYAGDAAQPTALKPLQPEAGGHTGDY